MEQNFTKNLNTKLTEKQLEIINDKLKDSPLDLNKIREKYRNMYYRCYSDNNHESHPYNANSTMCDEWLDESEGFFNFALWCIDNYYEIEGEPTTQLDKDILVKGNTLYSPDTCCFVPAKINAMFAGFRRKRHSDLPKGVVYLKSVGKYAPLVKGSDGKANTKLGQYSTPRGAWLIYALFQLMNIWSVADKYKDYIPTKLYNVMMEWEIDIAD